MLWFAFAILLGVAALVTGRLRHPLGGVVALNLVVTIPLIASAIAPERSAGRTTLALVSSALLVLVTLGAAGDGDPDDGPGTERAFARLPRSLG